MNEDICLLYIEDNGYLGLAAKVLGILVNQLSLLPVHAVERLDPAFLLGLKNDNVF